MIIRKMNQTDSREEISNIYVVFIKRSFQMNITEILVLKPAFYVAFGKIFILFDKGCVRIILQIEMRFKT